MKKSYFKRNGFKILLTAIILIALLLVVFVWGNFVIKRELPVKYQAQVERYAEKFGVDKYLIYAIIKTESDFDNEAKSSAGACGLMQLLPETAQWLNDKFDLGLDTDNLFDADTNICLGACYISDLTERFGTVELAITAYNGGEGNVRQWQKEYSDNGRDLYEIPYKETADYVKKVTARYDIYRDLYE